MAPPASQKKITLRSIYLKFFSYFHKKIKKDLSGCASVLDLGCGFNSPVQYCDVPFKVGVEPFDPYLQISKEKKIHDQYISEDIRTVSFKPKSFDATMMVDVIEHLTKEDGYALLKKMEGWSKKKIIIVTPNGYVYQDGYDNNELQSHKSGWTTQDFKDAGFKVFGLDGYKNLRGYLGAVNYKPAIVWRIISYLTQIGTFFYPEAAFKLYAVKNLDN